VFSIKGAISAGNSKITMPSSDGTRYGERYCSGVGVGDGVGEGVRVGVGDGVRVDVGAGAEVGAGTAWAPHADRSTAANISAIQNTAFCSSQRVASPAIVTSAGRRYQ